MRRGLLVLLIAVAATGCVSKKLFEEKERELAACRAELKTSVGRERTCNEERRKLEAGLTGTEIELRRSQQQIERTLERTRMLKAREAELREQLQKEILDKSVEISRLKDQLSVRVLDRILFRSGSADILTEGKTVLDSVASVLGRTDDIIRVEGHTDNVPIGPKLKRRYFSNWELSGARAASVVRYFEYAHGIGAERMEAVGLSKYHPVAPNDTEENRQRNRRVEIILTARKAPGADE